MKRLTLTFMMVVAVIISLPGAALADTITVNGWTWGDKVQIQLNGDPSKWVATAEFNISWGTWDSVYGYCTDPKQQVDKGTWSGYDVYDPGDAYTDFYAEVESEEGGLAAAYLLATFSTSLQGTGTTSYADITALQIAIWEVIYDYNGTSASLDLTGGYFKFLGTTNLNYADVLARAEYMLDAVASYEFTAEQIDALNEYFKIAVSEKQQDLLFGTTPSDGTPEPGTMLLLGSAMALGGYWRRRRGLKPAAAA